MRKKKKDDKKSDFVGGLFLSSLILKEYFCEMLGSYHSLCMLGLGFVASFTTIRVIHNYGKFKISAAIPK